jgi:peptide/nickel transport system permease protein
VVKSGIESHVLTLTPEEALARTQQGQDYWQRVWERLREDKMTLGVSAVILLIILTAIFAPYLATHDPFKGSIVGRLKGPGYQGHWLGTDETGRDLLSRLVFGARLSLLSGVLPVLIALAIGGMLGVVAGYFRGVVNTIIMRGMDVFYAFPSVLLAIAICGILGSGLGNVLLALSLTFIPPIIIS